MRMLDTRDPEIAASMSNVADAFDRQPLWKRSVIVAAGPLANFVLAFAPCTRRPWLRRIAICRRSWRRRMQAPRRMRLVFAVACALPVSTIVMSRIGDVRWQLLAHVFDDELALVVDDGGIERSLCCSARRRRR